MVCLSVDRRRNCLRGKHEIGSRSAELLRCLTLRCLLVLDAWRSGVRRCRANVPGRQVALNARSQRGKRRTWARGTSTKARRRCWAPDRQALGRSRWLVVPDVRGRPSRTSLMTPPPHTTCVEDVRVLALLASTLVCSLTPLCVLSIPSASPDHGALDHSSCLRCLHTSVPETAMARDTRHTPSPPSHTTYPFVPTNSALARLAYDASPGRQFFSYHFTRDQLLTSPT